MKEAQMRDLVAIILILGYLYLVANGDGKDIAPAILLIVGFYFGAEHQKLNNTP